MIRDFDISFWFGHFELMVYGYSVLGPLVVVLRVGLKTANCSPNIQRIWAFFYLGGKLAAGNPFADTKLVWGHYFLKNSMIRNSGNPSQFIYIYFF